MVDHDRLFKQLLSTFFLEFLELFAPELARDIEPGAVEFLEKEPSPTLWRAVTMWWICSRAYVSISRTTWTRRKRLLRSMVGAPTR